MSSRAFLILRFRFWKCAQIQIFNGRKLKEQKAKNSLFLKKKQIRASYERILESKTIKLKIGARLNKKTIFEKRIKVIAI